MINPINSKIILLFFSVILILPGVLGETLNYTNEHWDTALNGSSYPYGITTDGNYIWVSDYANGYVYKFDMDGEYISNWPTTGNTVPLGMENNESSIWIVAENGYVFEYDLEGNYISNFATTANAQPRGIGTINGDYLWVTDSVDNRVYKYYSNGTYTGESWDTFAYGSDDPIGIITNGEYFWIADETGAKVYKYYLNGTYKTEGDLTGVNSNPRGLAFSGEYAWVVDPIDDEIYKYKILETPETSPNYEERISALETWIPFWELLLGNSILETTNNLIERVTALEDWKQTTESRLGENSERLNKIEKYLDWEEILCNYMEDHKIEHLDEIGLSCDLNIKVNELDNSKSMSLVRRFILEARGRNSQQCSCVELA